MKYHRVRASRWLVTYSHRCFACRRLLPGPQDTSLHTLGSPPASVRIPAQPTTRRESTLLSRLGNWCIDQGDPV